MLLAGLMHDLPGRQVERSLSTPPVVYPSQNVKSRWLLAAATLNHPQSVAISHRRANALERHMAASAA